MRASVACEAAAVPSVSLVCLGFEKQAAATARGMGFDGLPLAVLQGHVDAQSYHEMISALTEVTIEQIISGLTTPIPDTSGESTEPTALDIVFSGTIGEINREFHARGWSDGNAIIPPTREAVEGLLAEWGYDPWRVIGTAVPSGRDITLWSVAVNAVMAGCEPALLPVLVSLAECVNDPMYGVEHSGNTTGADPQIIVSGPMVSELGFNHGVGALREGTHANTSVARWFRLFVRNVCGFTTDEHDKGTFGHASKIVLAEDLEALNALGWLPLAGTTDDSVTVVRINGGTIIGSIFGSTPAEIVPYLADGLVRLAGWELTHVYGLGLGHYSPLLVMSPLVANVFGRAGWSKERVQQALYDAARMPAEKFEKFIGEWSNLTAGRRTLNDLATKELVPAAFALSDDPQRLVPIVTSPDLIRIAVAGDPNRANAFVMSNDGQHGWWTTKPVHRTYADDLVCVVPGAGAPRVCS